jgi:hypothetical protein
VIQRGPIGILREYKLQDTDHRDALGGSRGGASVDPSAIQSRNATLISDARAGPHCDWPDEVR